MFFKSRNLLALAATAAVALPSVASAGPVINLGGIPVPTGVTGQASGLVFVDLPVGALVDPTDPATDFTDTVIYGQVENLRVAPAGDVSYSLPNGTELTYRFEITNVIGPVGFNGTEAEIQIEGRVDYFVDNGLSVFDAVDPSTAEDGLLWLSATLVEVETIGLNTTNGQIDASDLQFEVDGGLFQDNFDTNTFGGTDIVTFSLQTLGVAIPNSDTIFQGITTTQFFAISEPATLGLLGLGLVGFGIAGRRRAA